MAEPEWFQTLCTIVARGNQEGTVAYPTAKRGLTRGSDTVSEAVPDELLEQDDYEENGKQAGTPVPSRAWPSALSAIACYLCPTRLSRGVSGSRIWVL